MDKLTFFSPEVYNTPFFSQFMFYDDMLNYRLYRLW